MISFSWHPKKAIWPASTLHQLLCTVLLVVMSIWGRDTHTTSHLCDRSFGSPAQQRLLFKPQTRHSRRHIINNWVRTAPCGVLKNNCREPLLKNVHLTQGVCALKQKNYNWSKTRWQIAMRGTFLFCWIIYFRPIKLTKQSTHCRRLIPSNLVHSAVCWRCQKM